MTAKTETQHPLVTAFADGTAKLETVGGKGYSLARLLAAGLPVPSGFFVTTAAYRQFVDAHDLAGVIRAALADADVNRPATLEECSRAIQQRFLSAEIPAAIRQAVLLGNLLAGRDRYCRRFTRAVRHGTIECLTPPAN